MVTAAAEMVFTGVRRTTGACRATRGRSPGPIGDANLLLDMGECHAEVPAIWGKQLHFGLQSTVGLHGAVIVVDTSWFGR